MTQIYLDYAAATPVDERVLAAMKPFFTDNFYNPSALYLAAGEVAKSLEESRASVAECLGARSAEVVFTAGGTEANNLAIHGVMEQFPDGNMLVSSIEHESVINPSHEFSCKEIPVGKDGRLDLQRLEKLIDDKTVLVSVMYANNEIGTVQTIREVSRIVRSKVESRKAKGNALPLYLHTDAAQAANYLDLHVSRLGVDMMTLNGGKIYGAKQTGALYVRGGVELKPQILGGGQERGMRSGTENVAGAVGFAKALEIAQAMRREESARLTELQKLFADMLKEKIPSFKVNGSLKHRLPNNVHVTIPGTDNERLAMALDERGIMCAAGSACSASSDEPSHVLKAIGLNDDEARASLRFTMGRATNETAVESTVEELTKLV